MMKPYSLFLLLIACTFIGCSTQADPTPSGYGSVQFACTTSEEVLSRAATTVTVPVAGDFALTITNGSDYTQTWAHFTDFVPSAHKLKEGNYTASITWGDSALEGINKPFYTGTTPFIIESDKTASAAITAKLGNAQVRILCTAAFKGYFHNTAFTLTTAAGNNFSYTDQTEDALFVRANAAFDLTGTAIKQNGVPFTLPTQHVAAAKPQTRYTYTFDVSTVGSATVSIYLDDTLIEEIVINEELNPAA
ncbi:MAG: DUF4493 domain-containing protein [Alistipes sp.]